MDGLVGAAMILIAIVVILLSPHSTWIAILIGAVGFLIWYLDFLRRKYPR